MKPLRSTGSWLAVLGLGLTGFGLSGCHRDPGVAPSEEAVQSPTVVAAEEAAVPAAPLGGSSVPAVAPVPVPAGSVHSINGIVDPFLTTQLRVFIQQNGRLPESFAEFAGARLDSVPRLSRGLAFAIDPATQEVKIVRQ